MTWTKKLTPALFIALAAAGCAHTVPKELAEARAAYQRVSQDSSSQLAQGDVKEARIALDQAEHAYAKYGDARDTRDLAYIALRRAQIAEVNARGTTAAREVENARVYENGKYGASTSVGSATKPVLTTGQQRAEENQAALDEAREQRQEQETHHANVTSGVEE
jgi:hypothetical protein